MLEVMKYFYWVHAENIKTEKTLDSDLVFFFFIILTIYILLFFFFFSMTFSPSFSLKDQCNLTDIKMWALYQWDQEYANCSPYKGVRILSKEVSLI